MGQIQWPGSEPIPKSLEEAFALGWEPCDTGTVLDSLKAGDGSAKYSVTLRKKTQLYSLSAQIKTIIRFSDQWFFCPQFVSAKEPEEPKRERIFDVRFHATRRVIRVRAADEDDAIDIADSKISGGPFDATASLVDKRQRRNRRHGGVPVAPSKRGRK